MQSMKQFTTLVNMSPFCLFRHLCRAPETGEHQPLGLSILRSDWSLLNKNFSKNQSVLGCYWRKQASGFVSKKRLLEPCYDGVMCPFLLKGETVFCSFTRKNTNFQKFIILNWIWKYETMCKLISSNTSIYEFVNLNWF